MDNRSLAQNVKSLAIHHNQPNPSVQSQEQYQASNPFRTRLRNQSQTRIPTQVAVSTPMTGSISSGTMMSQQENMQQFQLSQTQLSFENTHANENPPGVFNSFLRQNDGDEGDVQNSFRDMRNERLNPISSGRVIDLQHIQPFSNKSLGGNTSEGTSEFQGADQQLDSSPNQVFEYYQDEDGQQEQERVVLNTTGENNAFRSSPADSPGGDQQFIDGTQLFQNQLEEQNQFIEELAQENHQLKKQLKQTETKLLKAEGQVARAKEWMKELGTLKEDIVRMKQTAVSNTQAEGGNQEALIIENEILKAKVFEFESQVNLLSRSEEEGRIRDRLQYEKRINDMNEENQRSIEQYQQILTKVQALEDQLKLAKIEIESKDRQIKDFEYTVARMQDEQKHSKDTLEVYNQYLSNQNINQKDKLQSHFISSDQPSQNSNRINNIVVSNQDPNYVAIRNKSLSGDKGSSQWLKNLNQEVEDEYQLNQESKQVPISQNRLNSGYILSEEESRGSKLNFPQEYPLQMNNYRNLRTKPHHHQNTSLVMIEQENQDVNTPKSFANLNQETVNVINSISAKQQDRVYEVREDNNEEIRDSPNKNPWHLANRCQKLEEYCRELVRINKVLDCENRLAIAQLINLTDPNQLNNLANAIGFVSQGGKAYQKKPQTHSRGQSASKTGNSSFVADRQATQQKSHRNKNLLTLRQASSSYIPTSNLNTSIVDTSSRVKNIGQSYANNQHYIQQKQNRELPMKHPLAESFSHQDTKPLNLNTSITISSHRKGPVKLFRSNDSNPLIIQSEAAPPKSLMDESLDQLREELLTKGIRVDFLKQSDGIYKLGKEGKVISLHLDQNTRNLYGKFKLLICVQ